MSASRRQSGFTLIELLVVMGILSGFLVMLVQLVDSGLQMFRDGETSQSLADRSSLAQRVLTQELSQLRGSVSGRDRARVDDRLVVQLLPLGLPAAANRDATKVQVLRAAIQLPADRELAIMDSMLIGQIMMEDPSLLPDQVKAELVKRRAKTPLRGVGNLLMLATRQDGVDDSLLELRVGWFLPGQRFPVGPNRFVDPFDVPIPGSADLPGLLVREITKPVLKDLLHVEFALWSQSTTSWGDDAGAIHTYLTRGASGAADMSRSQAIWDSARGGWLVDDFSGGKFPFDVGPFSENDASDDIQPHAILVRCIVAQPEDATPEGLLSGYLGKDANSLTLYDGTVFPGRPSGGYVKVEGEWIRYAELSGDRLIGLRRGQRGTSPVEHDSGVLLHVGRAVEFVVPILHAKDDWNG
jgi:prepilin-type N-terminal cleavage/methylation domain-containing protein